MCIFTLWKLFLNKVLLTLKNAKEISLYNRENVLYSYIVCEYLIPQKWDWKREIWAILKAMKYEFSKCKYHLSSEFTWLWQFSFFSVFRNSWTILVHLSGDPNLWESDSSDVPKSRKMIIYIYILLFKGYQRVINVLKAIYGCQGRLERCVFQTLQNSDIPW